MTKNWGSKKRCKPRTRAVLASGLGLLLAFGSFSYPAQSQIRLELNPEIEAPKLEPESKSETDSGADNIAGQAKVSDTTESSTEIVSNEPQVIVEEDEFSTDQIPESETLKLIETANRAEKTLLKGRVISPGGSNRIPILSGSIQNNIPSETEIELVVPPGMILDSEYSQKGDEVFLRIGKDIKSKDGSKILLPGRWYVRGLVTRAEGRKRTGRDGILEIEFDKLISPDNQYEIDINAGFSSKDKKLKSIAKVVAIDAGYVGVGSGAGALLGWQMGGPAVAISTYGISVGVGAAIGGTIGLIAALKRKGNITSFREGHVIKLTTAEGLTLPEFDPEALPSAQKKEKLAGLEIEVVNYKFRKVPWKDKHSRFLDLELAIKNDSKKFFHFFDLAVENDLHQNFRPMLGLQSQRVAPGATGSGKIRFLVGSPKRKYTLLFYSRRNNNELSSVVIN